MSLSFNSELCILNGPCIPESSKHCTYILGHGDNIVDFFAMSTDLLHQATRVVVDERVESKQNLSLPKQTIQCPGLTMNAGAQKRKTGEGPPSFKKRRTAGRK